MGRTSNAWLIAVCLGFGVNNGNGDGGPLQSARWSTRLDCSRTPNILFRVKDVGFRVRGTY